MFSQVRNLLRKNGGKSGNPDYNPNETSNSQALPDDLVPNLYVSQNRLYPFEQYSVVESVTVRKKNYKKAIVIY